MKPLHMPVMLSECIEALAIKPGGTYIDGTFGRGGHSREILKQLCGGKLICVDRDTSAINFGRELLSDFENVSFIKANFCEIPELVHKKADGILLDLGVSSPQLDEAERGFSYMSDGPLDMRMDRDSAVSAADIVNKWSAEEIRTVLSQYGEERYSNRIADAIVKYRKDKEITSTLQLVGIIKSAMPQAALREKQHPAKRTFQGLRIAVNDELGEVERFLERLPEMLNVGGRIAIITFHSLEDRIVKRAFKTAENPCICPASFPVCTCGRKPTLKVITNRPILPGDDEVHENPRSRSAKLRVAERV